MPDIKQPEVRHMTRHMSQTDFYQSVPKGHVIHHSSSLQTLLRQEDMRGTSGSISEKFKNFRNSSQNMLSKKMTALKAKLSDTGMIDECDNQSIASENKKKKSLFKRTVSESNAMAEILVRSVIHAHNSLDCILESHDNSPRASLQRQQSLVESQLDEPMLDLKRSPELDSYLSLPDANLDAHSSNATTSCESSSDEEDNLSDVKDNDVVLDTVSDIVKNVEIIQRKLSLQAQNSSPEFHAQSPSQSQFQFEEFGRKRRYSDIVESNSNLSFESEAETRLTDSESSNVKSIIPKIKNTNQPQSGLFQTAMKTMLFEKVSLVGTYTPPTSPKSLETFDYQQAHRSEPEEVADVPRTKRAQSPTSFSLMDFDHRETVLGEPFKSVSALKSASNLAKIPRSKSSSSLLLGKSNHKHFNFHLNLHLKSIPGLLKHKHKSPSLHSLRDVHDKEGAAGHWLAHIIKHKKHKPAISPTSPSVVDHKDLMDGVFKHFSHFSHKFKHKKRHRSLAEIPRELCDEFARKPTSLSLADLSGKECVLGGPFTAIWQKPDDVDDDGAGGIDLDATKKMLHTENDSGSPPKTFVRRRTISESAEPLRVARTISEQHSVKQPMGRVRTYSDSHKKEKATHAHGHDWDLSAIKQKLSGSLKSKPKQKSQGLLKTALQTVLMESVNDILATSHADSKDKNAPPPPLPPVFLSENLVATEPPPSTSKQADLADRPVNTEIDAGTSDNNINTPHARLTPSLRNVEPEASRPESGHHRTESVGAKIAHSPAKISIVPSMHRRSSDSDLSITPKGAFSVRSLCLDTF